MNSTLTPRLTAHDDQSKWFKDFHAFPDTLTLAKLANHVYLNETENKENPSILGNWKQYGRSPRSDESKNGYVGAAYINEEDRHVVISHQGTCCIKDFKTIIKDIMLNWANEDSQICSAVRFTQSIVNEFEKDDNIISISVTGHSLGGWLAQISTFCIENPDCLKNLFGNNYVDDVNVVRMRDSIKISHPYHFHTVVFECPGCLTRIEKIARGGPKQYNFPAKYSLSKAIAALDITVLLANHSIINSTYDHVGRILRMHFESQGFWDFNIVSRMHSIEGIVEYLSSDNKKITEIHSNEVQNRNSRYLFKDENVCNVNIFNSTERAFLEQILRLNEHNINYEHPIAEISEEYNDIIWVLDTIRSEESDDSFPVFHFDWKSRQLRLNENSSLTIEQFITHIKCLLIKYYKTWIGKDFDFVKEITMKLASHIQIMEIMENEWGKSKSEKSEYYLISKL